MTVFWLLLSWSRRLIWQMQFLWFCLLLIVHATPKAFWSAREGIFSSKNTGPLFVTWMTECNLLDFRGCGRALHQALSVFGFGACKVSDNSVSSLSWSPVLRIIFESHRLVHSVVLSLTANSDSISLNLLSHLGVARDLKFLWGCV